MNESKNLKLYSKFIAGEVEVEVLGFREKSATKNFLRSTIGVFVESITISQEAKFRVARLTIFGCHTFDEVWIKKLGEVINNDLATCQEKKITAISLNGVMHEISLQRE